MRIHRLIPLLIVLIVLALTTITTFKHIPIAVESSTAVAQEDGEVKEEPMEADGFSTYPTTETTEETACDLYLDAAEVERRALEEQAADGQRDSGATTSPGRFPISFKHVAVQLPGGIDHAAAGVATRHSGHGVIRLRGVPQGSTLISAHLVWGEITPPSPGNYSVGFGSVCNGGIAYQGIVYGQTTQPCWNTAGVYAGYIANVTNAILPGINGDYQVKGLKSFPFNNKCPWSDPACGPSSNALVLSEGASLIVIYSHPSIPPQAQIFINLGPGMFFGPHTVIHSTNFPILPGMQTVKHTRIGADGQVTRSFGTLTNPFIPDPSCGLRSHPLISNEETWIGGSVPVQIKGNGSPFNQDSDWNGDDGEPMNKLWDTHTDVFMNSNFLAATPNNYTVKYVSGGDCIVWAVHILGIR